MLKKKLRGLNTPRIRKLGRLSKNYGEEKKRLLAPVNLQLELFWISQKKQCLSHTLFQRWNLPEHSTKQIQNQLFQPHASNNNTAVRRTQSSQGPTRILPPFPLSQSLFLVFMEKYVGFPRGSEVKASAWNAGDLGSIPGVGRSPGEGNGNPLQYSCLENPMEGEAL